MVLGVVVAKLMVYVCNTPLLNSLVAEVRLAIGL